MDKITGKLPDLLLFKDGSRVRTKDDWPARKNEILSSSVKLAYGGMPPEPEFLQLEQLHLAGRAGFTSFRISTGRREKPIRFCLQLYGLDERQARPVVLTGDGCYNNLSPEVITEITRRGMVAAKFNRTELAHDMYTSERTGGLYEIYPSGGFWCPGCLGLGLPAQSARPPPDQGHRQS